MAVLLALALAFGQGGCARQRRAVARPIPRPVAAQLSALETRVDVVLGRRLVLPVQVQGALDVRKQVSARIDDGRQVPASLVWISVLPEPAGPGGAWLPPAGRWTVTPAGADRLPSSDGGWAVVLDLPLDAVGQGVWLNDSRIALNWLPDPGSLGMYDEAWRLPLGPVPETSSLLRLASPELASPLRRWRFRLLMSGLRPDARPPAELDLQEPVSGLSGVIFEEPVLEALARQAEARWQVALGHLWLANAELSERIKRRLVAAADFGGGVLAPAWPTSQEDLDALLRDLLNPRLAPEQHAERAQAWLEAQPPAAAWMIDDSGLRDAATGRALAACGVANLSERATLAWISAQEWSGAEAMTSVAALGTVRLVVPGPPPAEQIPSNLPPPAATLGVHAGSWQVDRTVNWSRLPVRPPGMRIDRLLHDWTMLAWIAGEPSAGMATEPEWATAVLIYRDEAPRGDDPGSGPAQRWMLLIECRTPVGAELPPESVRVWLGPFGSPTAVLKATPGGVVLDEQSPDQGRRELGGLGASRLQGKWVAQIPIPDRCVEADGTLRIGIERMESRGRRSTWPRPMLPWQTEPGRVTLHLASWDGQPTGDQ